MHSIESKTENASAFTRAHEIERLSGRLLWVAPDSRAWGIKIFKLREQDYFYRILLAAVAADSAVAWAHWAQRCVVAVEDKCGIKISIRRALGLHDFSVLYVYKKLTRGTTAIAALRDAVLDANVGMNFVKFVERLTEPDTVKKKFKRKHAAGWPEIVASVYFNKGILPDEFLDMTLPQLDAISDYGEKEASKNTRDAMLDELKEQAGFRR